MIIGEAASLFLRKEPLCNHEIIRYQEIKTEWAVRYAELYPDKEPTPKLHTALYHVIEQMSWLGGTGILHEGVVEAFHCLDNRDVELNVLLRARAAWNVGAQSAGSIRRFDQERKSMRREECNYNDRYMREEWERRRAERLFALDLRIV